MLAVVGRRCSHCQPLPQLTAVVVPLPVAGGPASGLLNAKDDMTWGTPYGQAIMNASASAYGDPSRYVSLARPLRWVSWLSMNATASAELSRIDPARLVRLARLPSLNAAPTTSPYRNSVTSPIPVYSSGAGSPLPPSMTSWKTYGSPVTGPMIADTSAAGMCLAASTRKPSTPSDTRSLRYPVSLPRTYDDSVARSDRSTNSQVWTSHRSPQLTMSSLPLRPQWWKSLVPYGTDGYA